VLEKIGPISYKLQLPEGMNIHLVFYANLLRRDPNDLLPGQIIPLVPPIVIDGEEEEEIKEIVDSRINRGRLQYKAS
jgi:hypothetical protein